MLLNLFQLTVNLEGQAKKANLPGSSNTIGTVISAVLSGTMTIAGLLLLGHLVMGAIEWINAGGDKSKIEKARLRIMHAIIGIIVLSSVLAVFMVMQKFLGLEILNITGSGSGSKSSGKPPIKSTTK